MLSFMRDLPLIETIAPVALAIFVWLGANILIIAPDIVAPRMTDIVWMPACEAGVATAQANLQQARQTEISAFVAAKKAEKQQFQNLMTPLMQIMGEDFALSVGKHLNQGLNSVADAEIAKSAREKFGTTPQQKATPNEYCGCIISELLQDRIATGLYSASFRLWKPATIQQLSRLDKTLISSNHCNPKESH